MRSGSTTRCHFESARDRSASTSRDSAFVARDATRVRSRLSPIVPRRLADVAGGRRPATSGDHGVQPLLGRRGDQEDLVRQRHVERALQLVAEFDERETVDAEVLGEPALHRERAAAVQLELIEQGSHVA